MQRTRLAPSPTGALHLGNARTFAVNWALARRAGWKILLRIEDLDSPRVKQGAAEALIDTLAWLGLDWDEGPVIQSHDTPPYARAMEVLASRRCVYPCALTRAQVQEAASAPHGGEGEVRYPASLRPDEIPDSFHDADANCRFMTPPGPVTFEDAFHGTVSTNVAEGIGDFVVWTKRGVPAYQLAVIVDDDRQGITQIVRGDDLLDSTARQMLLRDALGLSSQPVYTHLPLVIGPDGRRLAKRHGDTRLATYRERGVRPERIIALLGRWCGLPAQEHLAIHAFADALDLATIPRAPVTMGPEDDQWLLADVHTR